VESGPSKFRGLEFGDIVLETTGAKIVAFSRRDPSIHYTINFRTASEIIDVHKTTVNGSGRKFRETYFLMKQENLLPMLTEVSQMITPDRFAVPVRRLRFGWLRRRFMYLLDGQFPDEARIDELSRKNKRRRREFDIGKYYENLRPIVDYEECVESASSIFGVCFVSKDLQAKQVGIAFKVVNPSTNDISVFWIKSKELAGHVESAMKDFEAIARKYEIPKEEYGKYDF
jgi:hypothetical protein